MAMIIESHDGGDVIFFVVIISLSIISMIIFASVDDDSDSGTSKRRHKARGPVFVGGQGCGCGACSAGCGVCGTYLSWGRVMHRAQVKALIKLD